MTMVRIHSPSSEPELLAVVALLEAHGIRCFVENAGFGSLYPGPQLEHNARSIRVPREKVGVALELLRDFQSPSAEPASPSPEDS